MLDKQTFSNTLEEYNLIDITDFVKENGIVDELIRYIKPEGYFTDTKLDKKRVKFCFYRTEERYMVMIRFQTEDGRGPYTLSKQYDGAINQNDVESWVRDMVSKINGLFSKKYGADLSEKVTTV